MKHRQEDGEEFEASLGFIALSGPYLKRAGTRKRLRIPITASAKIILGKGVL